MTSGRRNEPPISTSCPRETMTSLPLATVLSTIARGGGVVVDHRGRLGAGQLLQEPLDPAVASRALAGVEVGLEQRVAGQFRCDLPQGLGGQHRAAQAVCRMMPVALITCGSAGRRPTRTRWRASARIVCGGVSLGSRLSGCRFDEDALWPPRPPPGRSRPASAAGLPAAQPADSASCSRISTEGIRPKRSASCDDMTGPFYPTMLRPIKQAA